MTDLEIGRDYIVAVVIATEVPPEVQPPNFDAQQIALARKAVADVIFTRTKSHGFPDDPVSVVLAKKQFSAVCREAYWYNAMAGLWFPSHVAACLEEWRRTRDPFFATHYFSPIWMKPPFSVPDWAAGMTEVEVPGLNKAYFRFFK